MFALFGIFIFFAPVLGIKKNQRRVNFQ